MASKFIQALKENLESSRNSDGISKEKVRKFGKKKPALNKAFSKFKKGK